MQRLIEVSNQIADGLSEHGMSAMVQAEVRTPSGARYFLPVKFEKLPGENPHYTIIVEIPDTMIPSA